MVGKKKEMSVSRKMYVIITFPLFSRNSHNFAEYYRKWNGVVYDWLWAYCYNDLVVLLESRKMSRNVTKGIAALLVIQVR